MSEASTGMSLTAGLLLTGAILTIGLVAGVLALHAHTIMPGLRGVDDRTFVGAYRALDRAIVNPIAVHLPLNDALKAAGHPDELDDLPQVRERFGEARWARWNLVRTVSSLGSFATLVLTAVLPAAR